MSNAQKQSPQRPFSGPQPTVSPTGRLVSSTPALQNLPIRTEEGRRVRDAFVQTLPLRW